jgi:hypothetical protein
LMMQIKKWLYLLQYVFFPFFTPKSFGFFNDMTIYILIYPLNHPNFVSIMYFTLHFICIYPFSFSHFTFYVLLFFNIFWWKFWFFSFCSPQFLKQKIHFLWLFFFAIIPPHHFDLPSIYLVHLSRVRGYSKLSQFIFSLRPRKLLKKYYKNKNKNS